MPNVEPYQVFMLIAAVAYLSFILGRASARGSVDPVRQAQDADELFGRLSPDKQTEVDGLLSAGKTIDAIKRIREETGAGLRESKLAADQRRKTVRG